MEEEHNKLVIFQNKRVRRTWFNEEWYYSLIDIVEVLTDSLNPTDYLKKMRKRDLELAGYIGTHCPQVEMLTESNKKRMIIAGNTRHILRIIQSIPSPKAEPFKLWLAQVGDERVQEIENPELAQERMKQLYESKGYSKDWIDKRLRGIAIRQNLTDEWKERGISEKKDFAILTAEISKATFGLTPSEYKAHKNLDLKSNVNLRDHMDDLELIFTMLGERVTTELTQKEKPETFGKIRTVANRGGKVAGVARKKAEKELGRSVVTKQNYLDKSKELSEE
jgi:hypothetical protein